MPKDRRQIAMEVLYQKARVAAGFPMEDDEEALGFVGATWLEILEPIPDNWLNECFKAAAQDGKQITPQEIIRAWSTLVNNGTVAAGTIGLLKGPACVWCNDGGMMYVTASGQALTWDERTDGVMMKKCKHGDGVQQPIEYRDLTEPRTE